MAAIIDLFKMTSYTIKSVQRVFCLSNTTDFVLLNRWTYTIGGHCRKFFYLKKNFKCEFDRLCRSQLIINRQVSMLRQHEWTCRWPFAEKAFYLKKILKCEFDGLYTHISACIKQILRPWQHKCTNKCLLHETFF